MEIRPFDEPMNPMRAREHLRDSLLATFGEIRSWLHRWNELGPYHMHSAGETVHKGDPASKIDGIAVRKLQNAMLERFGHLIHFVGEESLTTATVAPGEYVLQDDAVDGTQPAKALGIGYATTGVLFLHLGHSLFRRVAAGVASEQAVVTWVEQPGQEGGRLHIADPLEPTEETRVDSVYEGDRSLIAVVAARPEHRESALALLRPDSGFSVFNLGGSPMLFPLISLELGAVVSFREQTPWDALDVLAIEAEDHPATVITRDGQVDRAEVMQWFDASMNGDTRNTVPPHATVTRADLEDELGTILRGAAEVSR